MYSFLVGDRISSVSRYGESETFEIVTSTDVDASSTAGGESKGDDKSLWIIIGASVGGTLSIRLRFDVDDIGVYVLYALLFGSPTLTTTVLSLLGRLPQAACSVLLKCTVCPRFFRKAPARHPQTLCIAARWRALVLPSQHHYIIMDGAFKRKAYK